MELLDNINFEPFMVKTINCKGDMLLVPIGKRIVRNLLIQTVYFIIDWVPYESRKTRDIKKYF